MQYKTQPEGFWVKAKEDVVDGDLVEILDAGQVVTGEFGDRFVFSIKTKKGIRNMSFNKTTMNNLAKAYGEETDGWKGNMVKVYVDKATIGGERKTVLYLSAPDWAMDEDTGKFYKVKSKGEEMPFDTTEEQPPHIAEVE